MRPFLHIGIVLMLTSSLTCRKKVEIELPALQKRLVVHGYVAVGDHFNVAVGRTVREKISGEATYLENALVLLYANGVLKDTLHRDSASKTYLSHKTIAEKGINYMLRVQAEGYPSVEATATATSVPVTESLQHIKNTRSTSFGTPMDDLLFSFSDPGIEKNYYLTEIHGPLSVGCVYSTDPAIDKPQTSVLPFENGDCVDAETIFFTDQSFDGQLKNLRFSIYSGSMEPRTYPNGVTERPYLKRFAISEAFYNYYKFTSTLYDMEDLPLFTESTDARGNISNGYGLFTIFDVRTDTIR